MRLRLLVPAVLSGLLCQGCAGDRHERHRHQCEDVRASKAHLTSDSSKTQFEKEADALRKRMREARRKMGLRRRKIGLRRRE